MVVRLISDCEGKVVFSCQQSSKKYECKRKEEDIGSINSSTIVSTILI